MGELNGAGLAAMAAGSVLVYGGLTGKSPLAAFVNIVRGKSPVLVAQSSPLTTTSTTPGGDHVSSGFAGGEDATPSGSASGSVSFIATRLSTHLKSRNAVAGFLGNMSVETGGSFSPTSYNAGENAIGICQWEGGRRVNLQGFAASHGTKETDLATQVDFVWHELTHGEAAALLPILAAPSPESAASVIDSMYERSTGEARQERISAARRWYDQLYGGK